MADDLLSTLLLSFTGPDAIRTGDEHRDVGETGRPAKRRARWSKTARQMVGPGEGWLSCRTKRRGADGGARGDSST